MAFDTETTGLNPFDGDRIVEFGAVEIHVNSNGSVTGATPHDIMINPERPIPREASKISGITDDDVADAPVFGRVADKIIKLLEGAVLIAHNLTFDLYFIRNELEQCGKHWPKTAAEIDTLPLSQRLLTDLRSHKLSNVCRALGVPLENAHRATHDAEATGRAFVEIAKRHSAPESLFEMLEWADAVGPPPVTGHLKVGPRGVAEFLDGPFKGDTIEQHPDHLQWMAIALERREGSWHHKYPDSLRSWARRWLRARTSGRGRGSPRANGRTDWTLDPSPWKTQ